MDLLVAYRSHELPISTKHSIHRDWLEITLKPSAISPREKSVRALGKEISWLVYLQTKANAFQLRCPNENLEVLQ